MHIKMFDKIKKWYDNGQWPKKWVADAVKQNKITAEEYQEITGEVYPG